jgi:hypothetical protein
LACKYIHNPVLFRRPDSGRLVKFDLRYIVFVCSLAPLDVHLYKDFWPRCAINDYDLQTLDDVLGHMSVFNYSDKEKVLNVGYIFEKLTYNLFRSAAMNSFLSCKNCILKSIGKTFKRKLIMLLLKF